MIFHRKDEKFSKFEEGEWEGVLLDVSDKIIKINMPNIACLTTESSPYHQRIKLVRMVGAYNEMPVQYYWDTNDEDLFDAARQLIGEEMRFVFSFHPDSSGHEAGEVDLHDFLRIPAP